MYSKLNYYSINSTHFNFANNKTIKSTSTWNFSCSSCEFALTSTTFSQFIVLIYAFNSPHSIDFILSFRSFDEVSVTANAYSTFHIHKVRSIPKAIKVLMLHIYLSHLIECRISPLLFFISFRISLIAFAYYSRITNHA